jgi:hypothetical protein
VTDAWLGVHDPTTGTTLTSRDPFTGQASLEADPDEPYTAAVVLPDGSVALVTRPDAQRNPMPANRVDIYRASPGVS